ncbi:hypothetical protein QQ045_017634 [Rhodiola kirilowii]
MRLTHIVADDHEELRLGYLRRFHFRELQAATHNFCSKNILGNSFGRETQFQTELEMVSLAVHRNFLKLHGFCATANERILIYPFMSNGSVASRLKVVQMPEGDGLADKLETSQRADSTRSRANVFSSSETLSAKPSLDWNTRKRIAIGAARGLVYLHEQCDPKIIYRDVKAANILLDDDCEAVVGDFGPSILALGQNL